MPKLFVYGTLRKGDPIELYATEIMRGGANCLSNKYLQQIQQKIERF